MEIGGDNRQAHVSYADYDNDGGQLFNYHQSRQLWWWFDIHACLWWPPQTGRRRCAVNTDWPAFQGLFAHIFTQCYHDVVHLLPLKATPIPISLKQEVDLFSREDQPVRELRLQNKAHIDLFILNEDLRCFQPMGVRIFNIQIVSTCCMI